MASTPRSPRRGLPRVPGGEPWPPAVSGADSDDVAVPGADAAAVPGAVSAASVRNGAELTSSGPRGASAASAQNGAELAPGPRETNGPTSSSSSSEQRSADAAPPSPASVEVPGADDSSAAIAPAMADAATVGVRRGLPREPGGEPWPPASVAPGKRPAAEPDRSSGTAAATPAPEVPPPAADSVEPARGADVASVAVTPAGADAATAGVRRGLPREAGGEPWPPASVAAGAPSAAGSGAPAGSASAPTRDSSAGSAPESPDPGAGSAPASPEPGAGASPASPASTALSANPAPAAPRPPLTVRRTVWPGAAARRAAVAREARSGRPVGAAPAPAGGAARPSAAGSAALRDFSPVQLLGSTAVLGVFALALVGIVVLLARFVLAIGPGRGFLEAFPGEYPLPASAPVGLPAWLNWSHFLNSFFLLLIIRTGWQVRREKRPAAFWSPRNNKKRRISLALWFHQALDILWIANGVVFVVLLFTTGQWMRIVPTSWEVLPNALSAALQYASLDWPTENGWVNYNSLQQLSYFAITFVAAPLAIVSGVRLSGVWPKDAARLNRLYPVEWARKVHFPTMLFFVAFIVVHVALVLATGALRNLNHMYAARGAVDPGAYTSDPTGLLIFAASLVVMAAAWIAARPAVLVPIARLFGEVKQR
ncbi:cytochrome b/b6 domain-containing protein [Microbacterium hydrothermale]|uniref:cytochrome b/b6 domain-containing protein n=1 Tax=Microbacterium hydrothermale TaxID=857427 RepID=UPI0010A804C2|nr:cytochrome b/b6 domain-containing protein [Microbacterium hydrothermale]